MSIGEEARATPSFVSNANVNQQRAIETTEGALLIIAGPGSGKTFTLVERIVYLITQRGATPESLLVVTFTEKAAAELTTRISNRLYGLGVKFNINEMYLGTFHSICLRWLREYREFTRLKRNFIMMDAFDQQYFLYRDLSRYNTLEGAQHILGTVSKDGKEQRKSLWRQGEDLLRWLNKTTEEALEVETLLAAEEASVQALGRCYQAYQEALEEANALDFSTIQLEALRLLRNNPDVLAELRSKIAYLMVDEYQDTNTIQEQILFALSGQTPNICVVGDDDQGLYRFRGATIRNILQFPDNFAQCEQVRLVTNYRSHPDIIHFYNRWMEDASWSVGGQSFRFDKRIEPRAGSFPEQSAVVHAISDDEGIEAWQDEVLAFLRKLERNKQLSNWNQVAFLFRSVRNPNVVALAEFLEQQGVPVYAPRSDQFFKREEIRLAIAAIATLFPQFLEARKFNSGYTPEIWEYYDQECVPLFFEALRQKENEELRKWWTKRAREHMTLQENANYAFSGLFYQLLRFPLFSRYLDEDKMHGGLLDSRAMRNLALFSQLLSKFEYLHHIDVLNPKFLESNLRALFSQFLLYLYEGGLNEYEDDSEYAPSGCVSFLTIHQSKGLEFPVVVVDSLQSSPRKQFQDLDVLLEKYLHKPPFEPLEHTKNFDFRRLYYTAYSRAQNLLVLSGHRKEGRGRSPSKYFADVVKALPSWRSVPLQQIPLEHVKDVNLKREYSFTGHLATFENCAEQYRFFKLLEFSPIRRNPILFGTLVHQTIEDIHKTVLRGEEHKLSYERVADWFDLNYAYLTKRERVYLAPVVKALALKHVTRYFERHSNDWSHIRQAEVDVSLVKDDYILTGKIDLIQGEGDTVEIVDFKSEKKLDVNDPKDREKLERYRRQLEVYAHIIEERTGHEVSRMHLYYTGVESGVPRITFNKNRDSLDKTITAFDSVVKRIESRDFAISERPYKLCQDCDMRFYCDTKNWNFRSKS